MFCLQQSLLPIKLEQSEEGLTSLAGLIVVEELAQAKGLWRHNQRGKAENWHKELKREFGMEPMPCGQQEANALYFGVGVLA